MSLMPESEISENIIIDACIGDEKALNNILERVNENHFYLQDNRTIFLAIMSASVRTKVIDKAIILQEIKYLSLNNSKDVLSRVIGLSNDDSYYNIDEHIEVLNCKKSLRDLIEISFLIERSAKKEESYLDIISDVKTRILNIESSGSYRESVLDKDLLYGTKEQDGYVDYANKRLDSRIKHGDNYVPGIKTGFKKLDYITGGLMPSHLIILAARSGLGKTTFALNLACNMSYKENHKGLVFSLEMPNEECFAKVMSSLNNTNYDDIQKGRDPEVRNLNADSIYNKMDGGLLRFDDLSDIKINELCSKVRREKEVNGLDFVIIDYLQLIKPSRSKDMRHLEIAEISSSLKNLAKELKIPILCLAQLSRKTADRGDKKPMISDLRESGNIEQDADIIIMLHRESGYDVTSNSDIMQVFVNKNRHGKTGSVEMRSENGGGTLHEIDKTIEEHISGVFHA